MRVERMGSRKAGSVVLKLKNNPRCPLSKWRWRIRVPASHILGIAVSVVTLTLEGRPLSGQQQPTFSTDVKVVNVLATVRNKQGQIVRDLTKDDFTLQEDGRPQIIRYFSQETNLPLTLGLLVDTSMSQWRVLDEERTASYSFLDQMLRDKDLAFLIHFDREVELLQDLTSSRQDLESALNGINPRQIDQGSSGRRGSQRDSNAGTWPGGQGGPGWPSGRAGGGQGRRRAGMGFGGTSLYDAVYLASDELMKKQQGRKALIVLSDGVDNSSKVSLETAIEAAQRSDTLVYSILFSDQQAYGSRGGFGSPDWGGIGGMGRRGGGRRFPQQARPDGKKILERISKETGARLFEVSSKQPIDKIYSSIEEELRNQYSLGYTPDQTTTASTYHKIRVIVRQKDMTVQARDGYYSEPAKNNGQKSDAPADDALASARQKNFTPQLSIF